MNFATHVWERAIPIYRQILIHPFVRELGEGSLSQRTFCYYLEQDKYYLKEFARGLVLLGARLKTLPEFLACIDFATCAALTEQENLHQRFLETYNYSFQDTKTPACVSYTGYVLSQCVLAPVEEALATVLPCFWIYAEVGKHLQKVSRGNNPYQPWIDTYACPAFARSTQTMIHYFNVYAATASDDMREKMWKSYKTSALLEWHFWNDAYHGMQLDSGVLETPLVDPGESLHAVS